MFGRQYNHSCRQTLNNKEHSSQMSQVRHMPAARGWRGQSRSLGGGSPAKSTRLTLADNMVVRPASSVVLLSTTQVKTEWDLLDSLFMLVAAVCLFCWPRRSRRAASSTACTIVWFSRAVGFTGAVGEGEEGIKQLIEHVEQRVACTSSCLFSVVQVLPRTKHG